VVKTGGNKLTVAFEKAGEKKVFDSFCRTSVNRSFFPRGEIQTTLSIKTLAIATLATATLAINSARLVRLFLQYTRR
jgi:hypothetical protein